MRPICALALLSLAACATPPPAPRPPVIPAPERVVVVHVPVPAPPATTLPVSASAPVAVIRDSAVAVDEARRYVAWSENKTAITNTLNALTTEVWTAVKAMRASRRHGHYDATRVARARAAVDALSAFLANKGD